MKRLNASLAFACKAMALLFLFCQLQLTSSAQITEIYTDFGGYWKSSIATPNPVLPNLSHNVLGFTYNSVTYSTGVSDSTLAAHSITKTSGTFKALPVSSIGGTILSSNSTFLLLPSNDDGVPNGTKVPLPSYRMNDVLTDGINGLNISSGVTNIPLTASMTFPVSNIDTGSINDSKPDILYTQIAATGGNSDSLYFVNSSGIRVGNAVGLAWSSVTALGTYTCDLYTLTPNATCDAAVVTGVNAYNNVKEIRLAAFKLSEFGITSANAASVTTLKIKPGGASDPAFVAYNADAFFVATPVVTTQPVTQVVCPGTGQNAVFTVAASGTGLNYQWRKNGTNISGATSATYTITNVITTDAAAYDVIVSNTAGSFQSSIAYLNTIISTQPSPATQTIATGNTVTLSVSSYNATGFQWKRNGTDISGATSSTLSLSPLTATNGGSFTVAVNNSASSGCASLLSTAAVVVPATTLYSRSGALNTTTNWTVNSDGSAGSSPADFTRTEHTFIVRAASATTADLTIAGTLDLKDAVTTIGTGTTLSAGRLIRSGTLGSLAGSSTSSLVVGSSIVSGASSLYFNSGNQVLKNLTIAAGGTATLYSPLDITAGSAAGIVTVNSGAVLNTSDTLTLKSDASGTATIGNSAGTINGKVTIERYVPSRRAWRLMTAPITSTNAPSINAAWQEGATSSTQNPNAGYGTQITGGSIDNGFDQSPNNSPSIYNYSSGKWAVPGNLYTMPITNYPGYLIFVRGNRSYNISTTTQFVTAVTTVLRVKGNLKQGTQSSITIPSKGLTLIGNPFASPVSFASIIANSINVYNRMYVWDPSFAGTNGVGAYVVLDYNGSGYTATPSSSMTSTVQPGEAFFVISSDTTKIGSLIINEACKTNGSTSTAAFGRPTNAGTKLTINLNLFNADSSIALADGVLERFDNTFNNGVDRDDASKITNTNENLAIVNGRNKLAIERRSIPTAGDTLHLNLSGTKAINYQLELLPENFSATNITPYLNDNYTNTSTVLNTDIATDYTFSVNTDAASKSADRFNIVFRPTSVLAVKFVAIKAALQDKQNIAVTWKVNNEDNIRNYEVQKADSLNHFATIATVAAKNVAKLETNYSSLDKQPINGLNTYRIKSVGTNGEVGYSATASINFKNDKTSVAIYPNPVIGNSIYIKIKALDKGIYTLNLSNNTGETIYSNDININSSAPQSITVPAPVSKGIYTVSIFKDGQIVYVSSILIK